MNFNSLASKVFRASTETVNGSSVTEATIKARDMDAAYRSAATMARGLGGAAAVFHNKKTGDYAYGIKSPNTKGRNIRDFAKRRDEPHGGEGWMTHGEVFSKGGKGETSGIRMKTRGGEQARLAKQLAAIQNSSHLSPEEKEHYMNAASEKQGKRAIPGQVLRAVRQARVGVPLRDRSKERAAERAAEEAKKMAAQSKTMGVLGRLRGGMARAKQAFSKARLG